MALEQMIADLIEASNRLTEEVSNKLDVIDERLARAEGLISEKLDVIDERLATAEGLINTYISNARGEYPRIRTSPNQTMNVGSDGKIEGFRLSAAVQASAVARLHGGDKSKPGSAEYDFRDGVGLVGQYVNPYVRVVEITWKTGSESRFNDDWNSGNHQGQLTIAAYIRLIEGELGGAMVPIWHGRNGWSLYGFHSNEPYGASHSYLTLKPNTGKMRMALFARVAGYVDIENGVWGYFPGI